MDQEGHFRDYALKRNSWMKNSRGIAAECELVEDDAYVDGQIVKDAVSTIQRLATQYEPFFLAVGFLKPHSPYNAPRKYWDLYCREDLKPMGPTDRVNNVPDYNWFDFSEIRLLRDIPNEGQIPYELGQRLRHGYYAATSFLDSNVGQLLNALEQAGIANDTIVVFWSDHGYHLGENDHWTKVMVRELDARVPLIVKVPGKSTNRTDAIVEYTDLYPTLVEVCGLSEIPDLDGNSFAAIFDDPKRPARQAALTQVCRSWPKGEIEQMGYSLRSEHYRYTQWIDSRSNALLAEELYDHDSDPLERRNLASNPKSWKTLLKMREFMERTR